MPYKIIFIFIVSCIFNKVASAQRGQKDAALWVNIYVEKKINKKYNLHLNQQNRWNNNISQYAQGYTDVGLTRRINKYFKVMFDLVYILRRSEDQSYASRYQYYTAIIAAKRMNRFKFSYRLMLQGQNNRSYFSRDNYPVLYLRNKVTAKHQFNKYITAYVSEEIFLPMNNYKVKGLDRSRSFMGFFYSMGRRYELEIYMAYQHQLNPITKRKQDFIYGLGYSFKI